MIDLLEHSELPSMMPEKKLNFQVTDIFGGAVGVIAGIERDKNRAAAQAATAVLLKYPFPPKTCDEALNLLSQVNNDTEAKQSILASGTQSGNALAATKEALNTLQKLGANFESWIDKAGCVRQAEEQANTSFLNSVTDALNQEAVKGSQKKTTDNIIIYSVLGVLAVGTIIILLK